MTADTPVPDVRELAAAAVTSAGRCDHPGAETCDPWWVADAVLAAVTPVIRRQERDRQAAYLYSIIQSAENSEDGAAESPVEVAYDNGIMYAARAVLDNWAQENDWTADAWEYAEEIRRRVAPGVEALPDLAPMLAEARAETAELIAEEIEDTPGSPAWLSMRADAAAIARSHSTRTEQDHE